MHVIYPKDETDTSILSSEVVSGDDPSAFGELDSDSLFLPIGASSDSFADRYDDTLDNDPYLEPLSSLQGRLNATKITSLRTEEDVMKDTVQAPFSRPPKECESLKVPFPFIAVPKRIYLSEEASVADSDASNHHNWKESFFIPMPILNVPLLGSDCGPTHTEDRIRHLKEVIQQQLHQKLLRHVQTIDGSPSMEMPESSLIACLYMEMGVLEQNQQSYSAAIQAFFHAATLYRNGKQEDALNLARALDNAVVAFCLAKQVGGATNCMHRSQHKDSRFFHCMNESVQIRKQELGTHHSDTLEAIHHLAHLFVLTGNPGRAVPLYADAIQEHAAAFGPHHPNTASMAHGLGNAYLHCQDIASAQKWYQYAGRIYAGTKSSLRNIQLLRRDIKRLERIYRWTQEDPAQDENLLFEL
jgi:tetratricopeptide (TPR) repeat protein